MWWKKLKELAGCLTNGQLNLDYKFHGEKVTLSRGEIACILANAFLCKFPSHANKSEDNVQINCFG